MPRGFASLAWRGKIRLLGVAKLEAEPPDMRYQALPGNE